MTTRSVPRISRLLVAAALVVSAAPLVMRAGIGAATSGSPAAAPSTEATATAAEALRTYGQLPVAFVPNVGQADPAVRYSAHAGGSTVLLTPTESVLTVPGLDHALRLSIVDADPGAAVLGGSPLPGKVNYLTGDDPSGWKINLPTFADVTTEGVYPGIDLTWYGRAGALEYDFTVAPGADPTRIAVSVSGADGVRLDGGDLVMATSAGEMRQHAPVLYQLVDGRRRAVPGRFVLLGGSTFGFDVGRYDPHLPLVIDPVLSYSTHLGGAGTDATTGIDVDRNGSAYVTGNTTSADFPVASPPGTVPFQATRSIGNNSDAFVTKLDPTGSFFVYSTYLGGQGRDSGWDIAVDDRGAATVVGQTNVSSGGTVEGFPVSTFPTTAGAFDRSCGTDGRCNGGGTSGSSLSPADAFVTTLDPTGAGLLYSTFLGGTGNEAAVASVALGPSGRLYLSVDGANDFPTTPGAFDAVANDDAFVAVLDPSIPGDGSGAPSPSNPALRYSTSIGGIGVDTPVDVGVDSLGAAYLSGWTTSIDFPTTPGAFDDSLGDPASAGTDGFLAVIDPTVAGNGTGVVGSGNQGLRYATFLGGETPSPGRGSGDFPTGMTVRNGLVYVVGDTASLDYPVTPGAFQTRLAGCATPGCDAFVTVFDPTRSGDGTGVASTTNPALVYSTFLGTPGAGDVAVDVAVDTAGLVWVTGRTNSTTFPRKNAIQASCGCFFDPAFPDVFVTRLRPNPADGDAAHPSGPGDPLDDTTDLVFSTYLGGTGSEVGRAMVADSRGNIYLTGETSSPVPVTLSDGSVVSQPYPTTAGAAQPTTRRFDSFVSRISWAKPALAVSGTSVTEGDAGSRHLSFTVSLSGYSSSTVTVDYATADGSAVAGVDYEAAAGTLRFAPGEQTRTVTVPVAGDTMYEKDEKLRLTLSGATGATVTAAVAGGRIVNDDAAPTVSIADVSAVEGDSGTKVFAFTVSLSAPSGVPTTVGFATSDGTATAPKDYAARTGVVTIPAGTSTAEVKVTVTGNTVVEPDEHFTVTLSNPVGATLLDGVATGTVLNDD